MCHDHGYDIDHHRGPDHRHLADHDCGLDDDGASPRHQHGYP